MHLELADAVIGKCKIKYHNSTMEVQEERKVLWQNEAIERQRLVVDKIVGVLMKA